jgi:hypothetical protein
MKRFRLSLEKLTLPIFLVSLISLYLGYILKPAPLKVFQLSFETLNVETTAFINLEEETITFDEVNQTLRLANLNQGLFQMYITFAGGTIVDEIDLSLPTFVFQINQKSIPIHISELILTYQHGWVQLESGNFTIHFQNFVKIEEQMYSLIISDITIWKHT